VVPTVGISLTTLANFVRTFLNLPSRTVISGEVVESEKNDASLLLLLRLNAHEIYRSSEPVPLDRLDTLWSAAAETVLRHISPYHVALSVYDTKPNQAVYIVNELIRYYPATDENVAWAHIILGMRGLDYLRYAEAKGEFKNALAIAEKSRWAPLRWMPLSASVRLPSYASFAQVSLGSTLLEQGELEAAVDALNQAVLMDPTEGSARHMLGMARMRLAHKNRAVEDFDEADRLLRKSIYDYDRQGGAGIRGEAALHTSLGYALQAQGREGAEAEFKRAMKLDSSDLKPPAAYCNLLYENTLSGRGYDVFNKNYDFCISFLQRATGDVYSQTLLARYLIQRGKRAEAIEALQNALKSDDDRPQLHALLGNLYAQAKDWDAAVRELSKSIELALESTLIRNDLGNAYYRKGDSSQAAQMYATAIELDRSNALYHANRGAALKAQGTLAAAELEYQ